MKIKFNYKDVAKEMGWSFKKLNCLTIKKTDYEYYKKVASKINENTIMLDIGCGSGEKAIPYYVKAKKIYAADNEPNMLEKMKENVEKTFKGKPNLKEKFIYQEIDCEKNLPYPDEFFDLVVSRHCGGDMNEIYRVLKKGGFCILQDISDDDCIELKKLFNRGQNYNKPSICKQLLNECFDAKFKEINLLRFEELNYLKEVADLKYLLYRTPILDYYDDEKDDETLNKYVQEHTTEKGILLIRKLHALELKK